MGGTGIVCRLSVMGVTAEGAEGRRGLPNTVCAPLLVPSSAPSAPSAVNELFSLMPAPTITAARNTMSAR